MIEERHRIKVVCDDHPNGRSTIVQKFDLRRRFTNCEAALLRSRGEPAVLELVSQGLAPSCEKDIGADRLRSHEWCAGCSGSTWRVTLTGEEFLIGDNLRKRKHFLGSRGEPPPREAGANMRKVRHRFPFGCWCGLKVEFRHEVLERVLSEYADDGVSRVLLQDLAAKVS